MRRLALKHAVVKIIFPPRSPTIQMNRNVAFCFLSDLAGGAALGSIRPNISQREVSV
jgi:hypothetical protein